MRLLLVTYFTTWQVFSLAFSPLFPTFSERYNIAHWLEDQAQPVENTLNVHKLGVKRQVHVAAHVSAQVIRDSGAKLLKFSEQSAFAGQVLCIAGDHLSSQKAKC